MWMVCTVRVRNTCASAVLRAAATAAAEPGFCCCPCQPSDKKHNKEISAHADRQGCMEFPLSAATPPSAPSRILLGCSPANNFLNPLGCSTTTLLYNSLNSVYSQGGGASGTMHQHATFLFESDPNLRICAASFLHRPAASPTKHRKRSIHSRFFLRGIIDVFFLRTSCFSVYVALEKLTYVHTSKYDTSTCFV